MIPEQTGAVLAPFAAVTIDRRSASLRFGVSVGVFG